MWARWSPKTISRQRGKKLTRKHGQEERRNHAKGVQAENIKTGPVENAGTGRGKVFSLQRPRERSSGSLGHRGCSRALTSGPHCSTDGPSQVARTCTGRHPGSPAARDPLCVTAGSSRRLKPPAPVALSQTQSKETFLGVCPSVDPGMHTTTVLQSDKMGTVDMKGPKCHLWAVV